MIDQLIIGKKASYDDFEASLAKIKVALPKKKSIKEKVPFSNITHDFSAINGEIYWEEREIECVFEITADSPESLEEKKAAFSDWVMKVFNEEIHSPYIPDYHYIGTYEDMTPDDEDDVEKTTITVKFTAYPYKIANYPTAYECDISGAGAKTLYIVNASSHRLVPLITVNRPVRVENGGVAYELSEGTHEPPEFFLNEGLNEVKISLLKSEVRGVWVFNETISFTGRLDTDISFKTANKDCIKITADGLFVIYYETSGFFAYRKNSGWDAQSYRTVDFGADFQEVPDAFFTWLTMNAKPVEADTARIEFYEEVF